MELGENTPNVGIDITHPYYHEKENSENKTVVTRGRNSEK